MCLASAMFCLAGCPSSDPAVIYKNAYARSYQNAVAMGCKPKVADIIATGEAESAVRHAYPPSDTGVDAGVIMARLSDGAVEAAAARIGTMPTAQPMTTVVPTAPAAPVMGHGH